MFYGVITFKTENWESVCQTEGMHQAWLHLKEFRIRFIHIYFTLYSEESLEIDSNQDL